jgi:hypothetical protein
MLQTFRDTERRVIKNMKNNGSKYAIASYPFVPAGKSSSCLRPDALAVSLQDANLSSLSIASIPIRFAPLSDL